MPLSGTLPGQGRPPMAAQGQPMPSPQASPTTGLPQPGAALLPAGMRRNARGQVVPIRNPLAPGPTLNGPPVTPGPAPAAGGSPAVPLWLSRANPGASPAQLATMYQGYLHNNPTAQGNRGGPAPAAPGAAPPVAQPGGPAVAGGWGMPPQAGGGYGQAGGPAGAGDYNDPMNSFLAAVPMMNANMNRQIGDAMATAGFSGNRYGTSAMNTAGQIGAENALAQNALLQKTLFDYSQGQEDRALQATGLGLQTGNSLDQMQRDRLTTPYGMFAGEQARQDGFSRAAYDDFNANRLGWLPFLSQNAMSQGNSSPGSVYTTQSQGSPGASDWLQLLAGIFG